MCRTSLCFVIFYIVYSIFQSEFFRKKIIDNVIFFLDSDVSSSSTDYEDGFEVYTVCILLIILLHHKSEFKK